MATISEQERSPRFLELSEDKLPTERTLGVIWDTQEDMLQFTGRKGDTGTTKGKILCDNRLFGLGKRFCKKPGKLSGCGEVPDLLQGITLRDVNRT